MDDREQQRKVKHRLAIIRHAQEVTGNVAQTCRYYGISRQVYYTASAARSITSGSAAMRSSARTACATAHQRRCTAQLPPRPRWWGRSSICASTITSGPTKFRCTWLATTTSRSAPLGSGASSTGWGSAGYPPRSATNGTRTAGSVTRSRSLVTGSRST